MIKLINLIEAVAPKERLVYAWTFPEQNLAYIGLTGDEKKRASQHKSLVAQKTTAVSRYIRETGLSPEYKVVSKTESNPSGLVDEDTAAALECKYMEEYKANGWQLLNLAPCGSKGGSSFDEDVIIKSLDNFINSTDTSLDALGLLPGSDYTSTAIENNNQRDAVFNRIKDIVEKNNITSTKQLRKLAKRRASRLIEDWTRKHPEDSWQRELFPSNTGGWEKPKESINAFLAEPDNLDKDQLKLITKRVWRAVESDQEEAYLEKLGKIFDKYGVDTPGKIDKLIGNSAITWMLSDQAKNNPDNSWKDKLFPGGYPGKGTGRKRKVDVKESTVDNRKIFEQIIKSCCSR